MRALTNPDEHSNEGREPENREQHIDHCMGVSICKALGSLEDGKRALIDESRYTKPALREIRNASILNLYFEREDVPERSNN